MQNIERHTEFSQNFRNQNINKRDFKPLVSRARKQLAKLAASEACISSLRRGRRPFMASDFAYQDEQCRRMMYPTLPLGFAPVS